MYTLNAAVLCAWTESATPQDSSAMPVVHCLLKLHISRSCLVPSCLAAGMQDEDVDRSEYIASSGSNRPPGAQFKLHHAKLPHLEHAPLPPPVAATADVSQRQAALA